MDYLKIVAYLYLVAAAFFVFQGIMAINSGENSIIMFFFALIALFMFFFRLRYAKKWGGRKEN